MTDMFWSLLKFAGGMEESQFTAISSSNGFPITLGCTDGAALGYSMANTPIKNVAATEAGMPNLFNLEL